jgi:hypothetical protein
MVIVVKVWDSSSQKGFKIMSEKGDTVDTADISHFSTLSYIPSPTFVQFNMT